jgi:hypothetical protein
MLKGIHLTLLAGPLVPVPAPQAVVDALDSAQVTVSAGQRTGFQLAFGLSKESLINRVLLPSGFFDPNIRVILMATINGMPSVLIDGLITRQEVAPSSEPGQSKLTVTGEDVSLAMDLGEVKGVSYPAMPPEARVALIVAKYARYGMIPLPIPSLFPDIPNPTQLIPTHQGTDLGYIQKLADELGYVFYVDSGPAPGVNIAYFGPEIRVGVPQPALNVNMDAHTNVESLSFSYDGLSAVQPAIMIQEPLTKISIPIPVPNVSLLRPPLAARPALALKYEALETARFSPARAILRGLAQKAKSSDSISGSGQLNVLRYGRVLKARQLVGVRGAGRAYDGLYYVKSVTHNLKRGEYKQSFTLVREGLISLIPNVIP